MNIGLLFWPSLLIHCIPAKSLEEDSVKHEVCKLLYLCWPSAQAEITTVLQLKRCSESVRAPVSKVVQQDDLLCCALISELCKESLLEHNDCYLCVYGTFKKITEYKNAGEINVIAKLLNKNVGRCIENVLKQNCNCGIECNKSDIIHCHNSASNLDLKKCIGIHDKIQPSNNKAQINHSSTTTQYKLREKQSGELQRTFVECMVNVCHLQKDNCSELKLLISVSQRKNTDSINNANTAYVFTNKQRAHEDLINKGSIMKLPLKLALVSNCKVNHKSKHESRPKFVNIWESLESFTTTVSSNVFTDVTVVHNARDESGIQTYKSRSEELQIKTLNARNKDRDKRHVAEDNTWKSLMNFMSKNVSKENNKGSLVISKEHTDLLKSIIFKLTPSIYNRIAASAAVNQGKTVGVLGNNTQGLTRSSISQGSLAENSSTSSEGSAGNISQHDNGTQNCDSVSDISPGTTSTTTSPVLPSPAPENDSCRTPCVGQGLYNDSWVGCPGEEATQNCPSDALGNATWKCSSNSTFVGYLPNYEECIHLWIFKVIDKLLSGSDPLEVAEMIQYYANNTEFFGNELERTLEILNFTFGLHERQVSSDIEAGLREKLSRSTNFTELSTAVVDNLLEAKQGIIQLHETKRMSLGLMVTTLSMCVGFSLAELAAELPEYVKYNATFRENRAVVFGVEVLDKGGSVVRFPPADNSGNSYIVVNANLSSGTVNRPRSVGMILAPDSASLLFPPSRNSQVQMDVNSNVSKTSIVSIVRETKNHQFTSIWTWLEARETFQTVTECKRRPSNGIEEGQMEVNTCPANVYTALHVCLPCNSGLALLKALWLTKCFGCSKKILNSVLISMSVQDADDEEWGGTPRPLEQFLSPPNNDVAPVTVTLRHVVKAGEPQRNMIWRDLHPGEKPTAVLGSARCVFWNGGQWDHAGCKVQSTDEHQTVCACTHLSTFAVLMDMHDYVGKDQTLELLSWTCSGASVLCLLLTLLIFQGCRSIQGERTSIGKNLCACLLMSHVTTLVFLDKSYFNLSDVACSIIAGFLHYLLLASFCWMAIEGHHLYRMVVRVFNSGMDLRRRYLAVGYGLPAIVVGLTKAMALLRQERAYGRDELCWLSSPTYIWSFLGPVLLLTTINTAVLILALRAAVVSGLSQGKSKGETVWVWIRGWFSLSALLGVTWLFGFAYMEFNQGFMYIFVVLNGCQGVFIFLFRCVLSEQVRSSILPHVKHLAHGLKQPRRWSWTVESPLGTSRTPSIIMDSTECLHTESNNTSETKVGNFSTEKKKKMEESIWTTGLQISTEKSHIKVEDALCWTVRGHYFPSPKIPVSAAPAQPTILEESDPEN